MHSKTGNSLCETGTVMRANAADNDVPVRVSSASYRVMIPPASWAGRIADMDYRTFGRDAWSKNVWEHELSASDRLYLAAVEDPSAVQSLPHISAIAGMRIAEESELLTVAVIPSCRRRGIARELLRCLFREARMRGACKIFLEVRASDAAAQALYYGLGFEAIGKRRRYYSDDDALVMALCAANSEFEYIRDKKGN